MEKNPISWKVDTKNKLGWWTSHCTSLQERYSGDPGQTESLWIRLLQNQREGTEEESPVWWGHPHHRPTGHPTFSWKRHRRTPLKVSTPAPCSPTPLLNWETDAHRDKASRDGTHNQHTPEQKQPFTQAQKHGGGDRPVSSLECGEKIPSQWGGFTAGEEAAQGRGAKPPGWESWPANDLWECCPRTHRRKLNNRILTKDPINKQHHQVKSHKPKKLHQQTPLPDHQKATWHTIHKLYRHHIIIHIGTNSVRMQGGEVTKSVKGIIEKASSTFPNTKVVISTLLPRVHYFILVYTRCEVDYLWY